MKKLLLGAMLAGGVISASAQSDIFNSPDNHSFFGVRASLDIPCPGDVKLENVSVDVYKPGVGFSLGAVYNMSLVANLYFEPGLNLYYNAYGIEDIDMSVNEILTGSIRKFGLRVPLQVGYHFDFTPDISVSVFTGPELDVAISGRLHTALKDGTHTYRASESIYGEDGMSRIDCRWKFGASVTYAHNYYLGISGGVGMVNMTRDADWKFHENIAQITLGYNF